MMLTNISCYKFAPLDNLRELRQQLLDSCRSWGLKGTILLSPEGLNVFVSGPRDDVDRLVTRLRTLPGMADLTPKYSDSDHQPFRRMLVRLKREIIAFGVEGIEPGRRTSPKVAPKVLKQWLDEGKPLTLLDTRNDYEVKLGTFKGALPAGIDHFRDFPQAVQRLPEELKNQPVVMFCTGGIRCEKAGPYMEQQGFKNILQLDGGILKYFEECGSAHYDGECFVFDQRVGVDPALRETSSALCFHCQAPLTEEEQQDPRYQPPDSCPYCFRSDEEKQKEMLQKRQEAIALVSQPLPGSIPYDNERPLIVPPEQNGQLLLECFSAIFPHIPREEWEERCRRGHLLNNERQVLPSDHRVRSGERLLQLFPNITEPPVSADIRFLYEDDTLVVLNKPAPLPMHPCGRFNRNTLEYLLDRAFRGARLRPAHRLDANTTGLVVCAKGRQLAGLLQPQFQRGEVEKTYLVKVQGLPEQESFRCEAAISNGPGPTGTREVDEEDGLPARTEFRVLDRDPAKGESLLEAKPLTGRTNQIRVHLWHLGLPICGDPSYLPGKQIGPTQTLSPEDPPLCLHAWRLRLIHPLRKERVSFEAPPPEWAQQKR